MSPFIRPGRRSVAVLLAIPMLVLAGCSSVIVGTAAPVGTVQQSTTTSGSRPTDTGPAPAGLAKFYSQQLKWQACADYAQTETDRQTYGTPGLQCARMTVPASYDEPDGGDATVGVLKSKTTGDHSEHLGSVVFNPGGPGGSGMSTVATFAAYGLAADLRERFDLVGFDPRGTGASRPVISCHTDAEMDAERAANLQPRTAGDVTEINQHSEQLAKDCADRTGKDEGIDGAAFLGSIGTRDVARDMDILRALLGDAKLTYVGFSAGTRLGTEYAERFPGNVRAMILDGAIDPTLDQTTQVVNQGKGFQNAFNEFAKWCAGQPGCVLGTDPKTATAKYQKLVRPLLDKPLKLADGRVFTYDDASTGTSEAMYTESYRGALMKGLKELSQGTGTTLMQLADAYYDRDSSGHYSSLIDAFSAISCLDNTRQDPAEAAADDAKYFAAAPFMDPGFTPLPTKGLCDYWPAEPTMKPHTPNVPGLPTVLVISTTGDPATPYQAGVDLAKDLKAGLLTVQGNRHTAYLGAGIACADKAGNSYLIELTVPAAGAKC
jgi:pimeloyl-ACP methyl ester carboxylesterase